jgi:hypothetical protein
MEEMQATEIQDQGVDREPPDAAARGTMLAVLLSSGVWVGLALVAYRLMG